MHIIVENVSEYSKRRNSHFNIDAFTWMIYSVHQMLLVKVSKLTDLQHEWLHLWLSDVVSTPVSVGFQGILMCIEVTELEIHFT